MALTVYHVQYYPLCRTYTVGCCGMHQQTCFGGYIVVVFPGVPPPPPLAGQATLPTPEMLVLPGKASQHPANFGDLSVES